MTTTEVSEVATSTPFTVLNIVLDSGERLPCLVESVTWLPVRVATRWAVRYRRYRVQSSTLASNLRVLARVYRWARENAGYDLDNNLTQGHSLRNREIESLVSTLRATADGHALDTGAFDQHLAVIEDFLKWSLDSENRGGRSVLALEQLTAERGRIEQLFRSLRAHRPGLSPWKIRTSRRFDTRLGRGAILAVVSHFRTSSHPTAGCATGLCSRSRWNSAFAAVNYSS